MPRLHSIVKKAYAAYLKRWVWPFIQRIAACDRQLVLVDVFDILRSGPEKHNEIKEQMKRVLHCYSKVNSGMFSSILNRMPWLRSLRHVTFCATKADLATKDNRGNLVTLLRELFLTAAKEIQFDQKNVGNIEFQSISAHRCTVDVDTDHQGRPLLALRGRLHDCPRAGEGDGECEGVFFPGKVPAEWPLYEKDWRNDPFPNFLPRPLPAIDAGRSWPNIDMDRILFSIVKDLIP